ncbi:MAG: amino acid adenylation domain-containing protein, partial [Rickettsiales bacterium]
GRPGRAFAPPLDEVEERLVEIWTEVLGLQGIGVDDNFFELGGHSLSALRIVSRLVAVLNIELQIGDLFAYPTISAFGQVVKDAILRNPLQTEAKSKALLPSRSHIEWPVSYAQRGFLFLSESGDAPDIYNIAQALKLTGAVNAIVLEECINRVVERHDILRATYTRRGGQYRQTIRASVHIPLVIGALEWPEQHGAERKIIERLTKDASAEFDLERGPLIRAQLFTCKPGVSVLLITLHHSIADEWSLTLLLTELFELYSARSEGRDPKWQNHILQYPEYVMSILDSLEAGKFSKQVDYWHQKLSGELPLLGMPTDHLRTANRTVDAAFHSIPFPPPLQELLKRISSRTEVTQFVVLLSALKLVLAHYTGELDILVGSPVSGRIDEEIHNTIGLFMNTVVLRSNLSGDPSVLELFLRVRDTLTEAQQNQDVPFEKLVEILRPQRGASHTPFFQVYVNYINRQAGLPSLAGTRVERIKLEERYARFDLTLYLVHDSQGLECIWVYNRHLFESTTIEWISEYYLSIVEGMLRCPEGNISGLPFGASGGLVRQRRPNYASSSRDHLPLLESKAESIVTRFIEQVDKAGPKLAIQHGSVHITYKELFERAKKVASGLLSHGLAPDEPIATLFDQGVSMVVGILGILMTGRPYVPLGPAQPIQRLKEIIRGSEARIVVCCGAQAGLARKVVGVSGVTIGIDELLAAQKEPNATPVVRPDAIAYILYTSGSTGTPKGVVQSQENVVRHIDNYISGLQLVSGDRISLVSTYCFDAAVMDIFGALLSGASLHIIDVKDVSLEGTAHLLWSQEITVFHATPTLFRLVAAAVSEQPVKHRYPKVRFVVLGGEEATKRDVELVRQLFSPHCVFVNGYGPTESTVTLQRFIDSRENLTRNAVSLGFPVSGVEVELIDADGRETPLLGEIVIKSRQVALGYWRDASATEKAFRSVEGGFPVRAYRTGDIGRRLPDGSLEYLGRRDHQIKMRGYRVETREVEMKLLGNQLIREAAVVARLDGNSDRQLVAYVAPTLSPKVLAGIRKSLRDALPEYAVPSHILALEQLPRTPTGKIDRLTLASQPISSELRVGILESEPVTTLETGIASIWCEVLGIDSVSSDESLFDLGGHSISVLQITSRINSMLGIEMPTRTLFDYPTVRHLSLTIEENLKSWSRQKLSTERILELDYQRLLEQVQDFSEEEIDDLLASLEGNYDDGF